TVRLLSKRRSERPFPLTSLDDHLADLKHGTHVGVVRKVASDLLRVGRKALLKRFDRVAEDVTHRHVRRGSSWRPAGQSLVDRVVLAAAAHARLQQRHVLVTVVLVVESGPGRIGVHHAHFDHLRPPNCDAEWLEARILDQRNRSRNPSRRESRPPPSLPYRHAATFGSILRISKGWSARLSSACAENVDRSLPGVETAHRTWPALTWISRIDPS